MFNSKKGFTLIELLLVMALILIVGAFSSVFYTRFIAQMAIRNDSFGSLNDTAGSGLEFSNGKWVLNGESNEFSIFKRIISISTAKRDENENIVDDNGTDDSDMKKIISSVSWNTASGQLVSIDLETYLSQR